MYVYQSTNPCICGSPSVVVDPGTPDDCNCLHLCNITINRNDSLAVSSCGDSSDIPVLSEDYGHDYCVCGEESLVVTVEYFDDTVLESVTIDENNILTPVTISDDIANQYTEIVLKGSCGTVDMYFTVLLGINALECTGCLENEECICGVCTPIVPDVILT